MKNYLMRENFILPLVFMAVMSSCEKKTNEDPVPVETPDKYAVREVSMKLSKNVPNSDGCIYFSFAADKVFG